MRTSDIHSLKLDTLMAIFFNCDQSVDGNFVVKSTYRETKFLHMERESYGATSHQLSMKYGLEFNVNGSTIYAVILNNEHISLENFIDRVYQCILVRISNEVSNYNLDCEMALAMFLFRGSADFNRGYYSVDIKTNNPKYYDEMFKILLSSDELLSRLNLNFRELQHEYVVGKSKRNTQVRVNLKWFYDNVVLYYPHLNQYKTDVLRQNIMSLGESTRYRSFEQRLIFYKQNVLGRALSDVEIAELRRSLDFSEQETMHSHSHFAIRNQKIVAYAREVFLDECVGCKGEYDISTRTFRMPRNGRWYLEINHVIPYASDSKKVDVVDNLVKLCPACHRALTPNRAEESLQKHIIDKMLASRDEVMKFVQSMMPNPSLSPTNFVFSKLQ